MAALTVAKFKSDVFDPFAKSVLAELAAIKAAQVATPPVVVPPVVVPPVATPPSGVFAWPAKGQQIDVSKLIPSYQPVFSGELSEYHATKNPDGEHRTNYSFGGDGDNHTGQYPGVWEDKATSRMLATELEVYGGKLYAPELGSPFKVVNGQLQISAFKNPDPKNPKAINDGGQIAKYVSGLISSLPTFTQTYGYFEGTYSLPAPGFKGLWPASVLYGAPSHNYPEVATVGDEFDIFEWLSGENGGKTLHFNAHLPRTGWNAPEGTATITDPSNARVGLLWTKEKVGWFVDGLEVHAVANPANGFHAPMLWMHNLAVGPNNTASGWMPLNMPEDPKAFPAGWTIKKIAAYTLPA